MFHSLVNPAWTETDRASRRWCWLQGHSGGLEHGRTRFKVAVGREVPCCALGRARQHDLGGQERGRYRANGGQGRMAANRGQGRRGGERGAGGGGRRFRAQGAPGSQSGTGGVVKGAGVGGRGSGGQGPTAPMFHAIAEHASTRACAWRPGDRPVQGELGPWDTGNRQPAFRAAWCPGDREAGGARGSGSRGRRARGRGARPWPRS